MSLVDDIKSGSSDAIKQLYQENAQDIYDFAKGITNNHDTAMQATKSTLSKLVQQIQGGSVPANIHSEALKLAYDEACKISMPSVQNIKSPYDEDAEEEAPVRKSRESAPKAARRQEQYSDSYEDDYEEAPAQKRRSAQSKGNRPEYDRRQQSQARRSRDEYYDDYDRYDQGRYNDRYQDYEDDYDDYEEKRGHGAGFYICLVINIILVLLLIWFLIGLLVNLGVLPDSLNMLGYNWFNETIYPLF